MLVALCSCPVRLCGRIPPTAVMRQAAGLCCLSRNMIKRTLLFLICLLFSFVAGAQTLTGTVVDADSGLPLSFVNVFYEGGEAVQTDEAGKFAVPLRQERLYFSRIGYDTRSLRPSAGDTLRVELEANSKLLDEAVVRGHKTKYSRKNNPAVELMRKVIAAKKRSDLKSHDYYSINKYSKLTFAFNEVTEKVFQEGKFKRLPFLKEHVEHDPETGKLILPISVDESVTRLIYRRQPESEKSIVMGQRSSGLNDLFNTGDIMTTLLQDCFTDVNIYEDEVRLLQYPFISPVSTRSAISFYRFFIEDTLDVGDVRCIQVSFTPNNPQDFGFTGDLYVMADSTYRIHRVDMGIPGRSDVNWVERMHISQEFAELPTGEQVLTRDEMLVQLKIVDFLQKFQVKRTTQYSDFSFASIPDRDFDFKGEQTTEANAFMRDEAFWAGHRSDTLSSSEGRMALFMRQLQQVKGFKPVLWVAKAFIENYVETSVNPDRPSLVDIGPVNTFLSQNFVDGFRLRFGAQTTANLHPQLFLRGYAAYGFKDHRWKGLGEATWSFNKKAYLPREYPVNNLTFTYTNDVMSPSDKFLPTDKDNVFVSFKWTKVDHMMYFRNYRLTYDHEWAGGLRMTLRLTHEQNEPTGALFYQPLSAGAAPSADASLHLRHITTADASFALTYQPGAKWVNTKQRRIAANHDAPVYSVSHTAGFKGIFGSDYDYNLTELSIYKRFWPGSWGKIEVYAKGGVQWNRVPYPLLCMPAANLSYIKEDNMFGLIDNMEFLNDRYAALMLSWDLNGKIFNRIPFLRRLKWREYLACNVLWGTLTNKNNPYLPQNAGRADLFHFPGHFNADGTYSYQSALMDRKKPYVEVVAGIHNIFKLLHVEYVRRLTYLDRPDVEKWGIRFMIRMTF